MAVVVDFLSTSRLIIDGPTSGVKRQAIGVKHLKLTQVKMHIPRGVKTSSLEKMIKQQKIEDKWGQTAWSKKIEKMKVTRELGDFGRFVKNIERKKTSRALKSIVNCNRKKHGLTKFFYPKMAASGA